MSKSEIYFSLDIEANGRIPGPNSMWSFATVVFDPNRPEPMIGEYAAVLEEIEGSKGDEETLAWWAKQSPETYQKARENARPASEVMTEFVGWVEETAKDANATPVCVAYPATYDFMFLYWYMIRFAGRSPFGFQALDCKALAMAALGGGFKDASKRNFPKSWFAKAGKHTHVATDDAREQGHMFLGIMADLAKLRK